MSSASSLYIYNFSYIPNLAETQISSDTVDFDPLPSRKTLFECKVIIFLDAKQVRVNLKSTTQKIFLHYYSCNMTLLQIF